MTDFGKLVPAWVPTLATYKPGKPLRQAELESGVRCIKMASNENPFGPSPLAIAAIKAATAEANYYPDNGVAELHRAPVGGARSRSGTSSGHRRVYRDSWTFSPGPFLVPG